MKFFLVASILGVGIAAFVSGAAVNPVGHENPGICDASVVEGAQCEPEECEECGTCDWYMRCDRERVPPVWVKKTCDYREEPDGSVLLVNKLFWNRGGNIHGGTCTPWGNLESGLQSEYSADPTCKPKCDFWADNSTVPACARKYFFSEAKIDNGVWFAPGVPLMCEEGTQWHQPTRTCVLCPDGVDCSAHC